MSIQKSAAKPAPSYNLKGMPELMLLSLLALLCSCGSSKSLNQTKAQEKIQELGLVKLKDKNVEVEKIIQSSEDQAIAEANLKLAFKLSRAKGADWEIDAIRLGDRNWVEMKTFLSALDQVRAHETREGLQKLVEGIKKFREQTGHSPQAENIVKLTDILVPQYMAEVIRYDGWNRELVFEGTGSDSFRLLSLGADGIRGTVDDILLSL